MNQQELKAQIEKVCETLTAELPKASPEDAKFAACALIGVALLGELLLDIKRIADSSDVEITTSIDHSMRGGTGQ